jgi:vacuolar protein sorting-associated protein 54
VFLQAFHQGRLNQSAKLVEDEQWGPTLVSAALQRTVDVLIDSAVKDAPELVIQPPPTTPTPNSTSGTTPDSTALPNPEPASAAKKHIKIEDKTYFTVPATSEVLGLVVDYLKVIVNLNMLTTDTMSRIIEFLKAFNSRTCQVVLGAGAMRSAGLKNITAKHLGSFPLHVPIFLCLTVDSALASQSLSIMVALIPYVRETFRRHLSQKQAVILVEFDKLKRVRMAETHVSLVSV